MFESAELGQSIPDAEYAKLEPKLRADLLDAQYALLQSKAFPMIILVNGVDGAGKGETVNLLNAWMDPRQIEVQAFPPPTDEESARPRMWRFWRALPPRGKIGVFFGAWHTMPIIEHVQGRMSRGDFVRHLEEIQRFERMLVAEGVVLLKFWFHLSKSQQRQRMQELRGNPRTRWRVPKEEVKRFALYDDFVAVSEDFLRETSTVEAPWIVVPGYEPRYRSLSVGEHVLGALRAARPAAAKKARATPAETTHALDGLNVIRALDLDRTLKGKEYAQALEKWQGRLNKLSREKRFRRSGVVCVFEGSDAAGKGGAIRRVTGALDARFYRTISIAAPSDEEKRLPYLWRFWRHLPMKGFFAIYDRSWYGRVLVERVEGFAAPHDWQRAYAEIADFERDLDEHGLVVAKFWLAISADEQLKRFKARETSPFKRFKLTEEDWRNREKWDAYEAAVCEMVDRTSTSYAPWTLVEANDKQYARIKVLKTLVRAIEARLDEA
ncbi:MAG: polyphosphate:AMP phosphotransferase [Hyphomicrobiaceae bacterium]|nr:polyphosphate:AMP phosphotransferase [Hyphomicrobiaceae bacterium]